MGYFEDSLIFLGSEKEAGIIIYRYNNATWERIASVGNDFPKSLFFDHRPNGLYVFSEAAGTSTVTTYAIKNKDPVLTQKATQDHKSLLPKPKDLQHMCVDVDQTVAYAVGRNHVSAFLQNLDATIFYPFDRTYVCHYLAINDDFIVEKAFIAKTHKHFGSFFEVFCIDYWPFAAPQRIFIKFKYESTFDNLNDTSVQIRNYYTCVVDLKESVIHTYENFKGDFNSLHSITYTFIRSRECQTSTIADIVAAKKQSMLFVANREHKSITSCTFSYHTRSKLLVVENVKLPGGSIPKRLFFNSRNNCLYVATKNNSIVIYSVNVMSGRMGLVHRIVGVPSPTCIVAT